MNIKVKGKKMKLNNEPIVKVMRAVLIVFSFISMYPIFFVFITSLKTNEEFYQNIWALPSKFRIENYYEAIVKGHIGDYFMNSIIIAVVSLFIILIMGTLAAYALARLKVPGVEIILVILLACQILPTEAMLIPLYIMISRLGILKIPYLPIIVPYIGWLLPSTIIILKNFFDTMPESLLEAARIDGSSEIKTMFKIVLPLMKGAMSTCLVLNFCFVWGELMWAQIATLLTDKGLPITVGLLNFKGTYSTNWGLLAAAICIILVPLFVMFIALQKYFVEGLTAGGVKG